MAHTTVREVLAALDDVDFPADKDQLLRAASSASEEVRAALRAMPPEVYQNRDEVARSVRADSDADTGYSAAQRAEQARQGGRPGQSQYMRDVPKPPIEEELDE